MNACRQIHVASLVAFMIGGAGTITIAQDAATWQVPPAVIPVDFTQEEPAPRKSLTDEGLAWEFPVTFAMLRENVTLAAVTPEAGEVFFALETEEALVDIKSKRVDAGKVEISIQSRLGRLGVEALRASVLKEIKQLLSEPRGRASDEAKDMRPPALRRYLGSRAAGLQDQQLAEAYVDRRGIELGKRQLQAALEALVAKRPRWVTRPDQAAWLKADAAKLHTEYQRLLGLLLADEHLRRCGIDLDTNIRNYAALIESKFKALHAFVTGGASTGEADGGSVRTLSREEMAGLRKALVVQGMCRFVPAVDQKDANSQWFNAQRVGTSVTGVNELLVLGALDPAQADRSDWWILVGFSEDQVQLDFPDRSGIRHEIYRDPLKRTCLRIIAKDQQRVTYEFRLKKRKSTGSGDAVVVHESPSVNHVTFPY